MSIGERLKRSPRRTTYNWACSFFCSFITLTSLLDVFKINGFDVLSEQTRIVIFILPSVSIGCCIFALIMNSWCSEPPPLSFYLLEGALLFILASFWTWVVFRFTGVHGPINGPSNSYFGVWGSFFYSISTFGVWLKEFRLLQ